MSLSRKQIEVLNNMELNKWMRFDELPGTVSVITMKKLVEKKMCVAAHVRVPHMLTNRQTETGKVECEIEYKVVGVRRFYQGFIKKIDDSYKLEERISRLESIISKLEKK